MYRYIFPYGFNVVFVSLHFVDNGRVWETIKLLCHFKRAFAKALEKHLATEQGRVELLSDRWSVQQEQFCCLKQGHYSYILLELWWSVMEIVCMFALPFRWFIFLFFYFL